MDTKQKFDKFVCFQLNKENLNETFLHIQVDANHMQLVLKLEVTLQQWEGAVGGSQRKYPGPSHRPPEEGSNGKQIMFLTLPRDFSEGPKTWRIKKRLTCRCYCSLLLKFRS